MKNSIKQLAQLEVQLGSSLNLSAREWNQFGQAMTQVASSFEAFARKHLPKGKISISLHLCGKSKIRALNREFRKKDKITDVLSFQMQDNARDLKVWPLPQNHLGDVFICREVAISQAREFKISEQDEWIHLAVHGLLHLCGFDHEISAREEAIMQKHEKQIIDTISKKRKQRK